MTEATVTALWVAGIGALPPTLAALTGFALLKKQGKVNTAATVSTVGEVKASVQDAVTQVGEVKAQNETLLQKTDVIHELTNGTLHTVKAELMTANARIEALEKLLHERFGAPESDGTRPG